MDAKQELTPAGSSASGSATATSSSSSRTRPTARRACHADLGASSASDSRCAGGVREVQAGRSARRRRAHEKCDVGFLGAEPQRADEIAFTKAYLEIR